MVRICSELVLGKLFLASVLKFSNGNFSREHFTLGSHHWAKKLVLCTGPHYQAKRMLTVVFVSWQFSPYKRDKVQPNKESNLTKSRIMSPE